MHRTLRGRLAKNQIDRIGIPIRFNYARQQGQPAGVTIDWWKKERVNVHGRAPDIRQMQLEEVELILAVEKTNARFVLYRARRSMRQMQNMGVAKETGYRIIFYIEQSRLRVYPIRARRFNWRTKSPRVRWKLFRQTKPEGDGRWDQKSQCGGCSKWEALFLNAVT